MGLAAYVERRKEQAQPGELLFPDAGAKVRGQIGYNIGNEFSARIRKLHMEGRNLGLHSFRHNFQDALRRAGLHGTPLGLGLAGRDEGGSARGYGKGYTMAEVLAELAKVDYPGLRYPAQTA